jgi:hypothetical protein
VLNVRFDRTNRIKDPQVRALGEIDTAIEVGVYAGFAKKQGAPPLRQPRLQPDVAS